MLSLLDPQRLVQTGLCQDLLGWQVGLLSSHQYPSKGFFQSGLNRGAAQRKALGAAVSSRPSAGATGMVKPQADFRGCTLESGGAARGIRASQHPTGNRAAGTGSPSLPYSTAPCHLAHFLSITTTKPQQPPAASLSLAKAPAVGVWLFMEQPKRIQASARGEWTCSQALSKHTPQATWFGSEHPQSIRRPGMSHIRAITGRPQGYRIPARIRGS